MTKWLENLQKIAAELPERYMAPMDDSPVKEGEMVLGVMSESLRRLWGVCEYLDDNRKRLRADHLLKHADGRHTDKAECTEAIKKEYVSEREVELVMDIFWKSLRYEFGPDIGDIGIRDGGQVVSFDSEDTEKEESLRSLLETLETLVSPTRGRGH